MNADLYDLIEMMNDMNRIEAEVKAIQSPKPMPKSYQKSKAFRNQKTLRKK